MVQQRRLIDPLFAIPEGAEDEFEYSDTLLDIEDEIDETDDIGVDEGLETPSEFTIISQTIRRGDGNHQFVDVVFEVDDVDGATKYEIKVTKT